MRVYIYPKDIMRISGKGASFAYKKFNQVREFLAKGKDQPVTVEEFATFENINPEEVRLALAK
jgi:hypothetical protein